MIPRTIHYCWFGRNPKNHLAKKCIRSWKKKCKGFKIIEWNEDNFDISGCPLYVKQAYNAKKWAFVSDYVRLKVIYDYGGIYLDTDVQILKPFDTFLNYKSFFGFQDNNQVATGLGFGSEPHSIILRELIKQYETIPFLLIDGTFDLLPCPKRNTEVFIKHGLIQNGTNQLLDNEIMIYSPEYFCPISYDTMEKNITKNTYSIHWFNASWRSINIEKINTEKIQKRNNRRHFISRIPNRCVVSLLGEKKYDRLKKLLRK